MERYQQLLADLPGIGLPEGPSWACSNWQSYCIRLPENCDQRQVMQQMLDAGIATRQGIMCAHREPAYANRENWSCGLGSGTCDCPPGTCVRLSESEQAQDHNIILPLFQQITEAEQELVVAALREACVESLNACS